MSTPANQLFGEEDLIRINQALKDLDAADQVIELGKQAGLDMQEQETRSRENKDRLLRLKNTFFPGR